jgi:hypothetical protein
VYNHYLDCRDNNYYVCEDSITDVLALPGEKVKHLTPVLACHDRSLRVLKDSSLMYSVELPGPPTTLALFYNDGGENGDEILYGTEDGKVGLVQLTRYSMLLFTAKRGKNQKNQKIKKIGIFLIFEKWYSNAVVLINHLEIDPKSQKQLDEESDCEDKERLRDLDNYVPTLPRSA